MSNTAGGQDFPSTSPKVREPERDFCPPTLADLVAAPLQPVSLTSLQVSFHSSFDLCSHVIRASNEVREPCSCVWKQTGPRERQCRACQAWPLDGFSSGINGPGFIALTYRLFHPSVPEVTLAMAISFFDEDHDYQKIIEILTNLDPTDPQSSRDAALSALDQPIEMVRNYANRTVVKLGRISLTHDALYASDAAASSRGSHTFVRVAGWSNRFVDGFLVFQNPSIISQYPDDDCAADWVSGMIFLDSRLSDSFERDTNVLSPEDTEKHHETARRPAPRSIQREAANISALLNAEVSSLRTFQLLEESLSDHGEVDSSSSPPGLREKYLDALSWMVDVSERPRRFGRRKRYTLLSRVDAMTRAAMLWRRGHFERALRTFGKRPINLDAIRGGRPPSPLMSKNFCDGCGGRKRLGFSVCNRCERNVSTLPREAHDYLPQKLRKRILRQSAPEYLTTS
jgi:hypothetical protein